MIEFTSFASAAGSRVRGRLSLRGGSDICCSTGDDVADLRLRLLVTGSLMRS